MAQAPWNGQVLPRFSFQFFCNYPNDTSNLELLSDRIMFKLLLE
jgi:hypothetical protein